LPKIAAIPVTIAQAEKADFPVYLNGLGAVEPYQTVLVRSRVDGEVIKIDFKQGQMVKKGDVLVEIDPRPDQAASSISTSISCRTGYRVGERQRPSLSRESIKKQSRSRTLAPHLCDPGSLRFLHTSRGSSAFFRSGEASSDLGAAWSQAGMVASAR
jgi:Biotin-lipoyl like